MLINLTVDCIVKVDARSTGIRDGHVTRQQDRIVKRDRTVVGGHVCIQLS